MTEYLNLRAFRKSNSLTQDDIAAYLGVTKAFISQVENGRVAMPEDKLYKLMSNDRGWKIPTEEIITKFVQASPFVKTVKLIPHEARGLNRFLLVSLSCNALIYSAVRGDGRT